MTFASVALCLVLAILLYGPFRHPDLQIAILPTSGTNVPAFGGASTNQLPRFSGEDRAAVRRLAPATPRGSVVDLPVPKSAADFESLPNMLPSDSDVLILYLQSQAVSIGTEPGFRCDLGGPRSADNFVPLSSLLRILTEHADSNRAVLLLVIDQGAVSQEGVNAFPTLVAEAVHATHNRRLWVLCSNSLMENSEVLWSRRRSVFSEAVTRGLGGAADLDGDQAVDLFELAGFVGNQVSTTVHTLTRGQASQTPFLCWGGGAIPDREPPVLAPVLARELAETDSAPVASPFLADADSASIAESTGASTAEPASSEAGDGQASGTDSNQPEAAAVAPAEKLPELVIRGWELRDRLESGPLNPMVYAPHEWRSFTNGLQQVESMVWADAGTTALTLELEDVLVALDAAATGTESPRPVPRAMQPLVAAVRDQATPPRVESNSLVLATWLARQGGQSLPEETTTAWQSYTTALEATDDAALTAWLAAAPPELFTWEELALVRTLTPALTGDWPLLSRVLKLRIEAERTALAAEPAAIFREPMHNADSARIAAERLLVDGVDPHRVERAHRLLQEAENQYAAARSAAQILSQVRDRYVRQSFLVSEYCRWWARNGPVASRFGPAEQDLHDLIHELTQLSAVLQIARPSDRARLQSGLANLRFLGDRICADVCAHQMSISAGTRAGPATSWQVQALLDTTLPCGKDRLALLQSVTTVEAAALASMPQPAAAWPLPQRSVSVTDCQFLISRARLSAQLVALAAGDAADTEDHIASLQAAVRRLETSLPVARDGDSHSSILERHREFVAQLNGATTSVSKAVTSGIPVGNRVTSLDEVDQALFAMERALHCSRVLNTECDTASLSRLAMADRLAWYSQRLRIGAGDLDAEIANRRLTAAAACDRQSRDLLGWTAPVATATSPVQIAAPPRIELYSPEHQFDLTLSTAAGGESPAWVVVDYDPRLLSVSAPPGFPVYRQPELAEPTGSVSAAEADASRLRQLVEEEPRTMLLRDGANRLELEVRRLATADHPTKLIVKVSRPGGWERTTVAIDLPTPDFAALEVSGRNGSWTQDENGIILHPYPNQPTEYQLRLRNLTDQSRTVDVRLLALDAATPVSLPPGVVSAESASEILSRMPGLKMVGGLANQQLPPQSGPLVSDEPPEPPAEPPPLGSFQYGGVLAIVDRESGQTALKSVQVRPQHPRRYLRPEVSYDLQRERVQIVVRAEDPGLLPAAGSSINVEFSVPLQAARQLDGAILPGRSEARLFADIPAAPGKTVELRLHVDDYPRAFLFRVPCDRPVSFVPESHDALSINVVSPSPGTAFQTPQSTIPVSLQIDAPAGAFRNPATLAEIGFDLNRDRFLIDEPAMRLTSDRSVTIQTQPLTPSGRLVLETSVTDHQLSLPAIGLRTARVNVQGRMQVGGDTSWSQPIEVVLDATPPVIRDVALQPGHVAAATDPLQVTVSTDDGEGSGTARVELAFDVANTGEFTGESAVVPAARGPSGQWTAAVPLEELPPGNHGLLIRAIDRTDNVSATRRESVTVLSAEAAEARQIALAAPVVGSARYGDRPVPNARVTLIDADDKEVAETQADVSGRFQLPKVGPGDYTLIAEGLIRNKVRRAETPVTVPPPPGVVEAVPLQLR